MVEKARHDYLELLRSELIERIDLIGDQISLGSSPMNDVALSDSLVSRLHAAFQRYPSGWSIRDLGSRNGTFVNGDQIWGERRLLDGDEIRVGETILVYRHGPHRVPYPTTDRAEPAPDLTRREHDVLVALCRPLADGDTFTGAASIRDIAAELVVTEAAVKQHMANLYRKFQVAQSGVKARTELANLALKRGAVTLAQLRTSAPGPQH